MGEGHLTDREKSLLGRAMLASDIAYFKAAANNEQCAGGVLSQIAGFPDLPLATVLHSVSRIDEAEQWIAEVEAAFAALDVHWVRFYLQSASAIQRQLLQVCHYQESLELGLVARLEEVERTRLELRHCCSEEQWQQYNHLCVISGTGPDGHDMSGDSYARVSRLKVEAGYMMPFLAVLDGNTAGFVNLSVNGDFARCKNVLVHPDYRGRGVGRQLVLAAMGESRRLGARYFGCFALAGGPSVNLYKSLGMEEVTRQLEWVRLVFKR